MFQREIGMDEEWEAYLGERERQLSVYRLPKPNHGHHGGPVD